MSYAVDSAAASDSYDPDALADGQHTVTVTQTDAAGNVSAAESITFTLDRSGPSVRSVVVSGPDITGGSGEVRFGDAAKFSLKLSEAVAVANADRMKLSLSDGAHASSTRRLRPLRNSFSPVS